MTRYLLDSNILTALEDRDKPAFPAVTASLTGLSDDDEVFIPILAAYEYQHGIAKAPDPLKDGLRKAWGDFAEQFPLAPLTLRGARLYGELKARYEDQTGASRGISRKHTVDLILASMALDLDAVLVSDDRVFEALQRIEPALQLENWRMSG